MSEHIHTELYSDEDIATVKKMVDSLISSNRAEEIDKNSMQNLIAQIVLSHDYIKRYKQALERVRDLGIALDQGIYSHIAKQFGAIATEALKHKEN